MKTKAIITFAILCYTSSLISQNTSKYVFSLGQSYGHVFATNSTLKGVNQYSIPIVYSKRTSVMIGKRLNKDGWQKSFNTPTVGLLFFQEKFGNGDYEFNNTLGSPLVISSYFKSKLIGKKKVSLNYDFGLGMAVNWKPYNENNYNVTLGSKKSFYIQLGATVNYQLSKRLGLEAALGLTHYSNGALALPNFGINSLNSTLKLAYNFGPGLEVEKYEYNTRFKPKTTIDLCAFGGSKSAFAIYDTLSYPSFVVAYSYAVYGMSATINRQIKRRSKIGLGIIISENNSNGAVALQKTLPENYYFTEKVPSGSFEDNLQISIFPSYEYLVGPVSVIAQPSFYIHRGIKLDYIPTFHQRLGVKYNTKKGVFFGFNLRAYDYHISDFIEWNIGYSIGKNRN